VPVGVGIPTIRLTGHCGWDGAEGTWAGSCSKRARYPKWNEILRRKERSSG